MDASKLYNLIWDIVTEEERLEINPKLQIIINSVNQLAANRNNTQAQTNLDNTKKVILEPLRKSNLNMLSPSNKKILDKIGASKYIGIELANSIESLLEVNSFNVNTIVANLTSLKKEREDIFKTYISLKGNFKTLGISPHWWNDDCYEVGLLLPESVTNEHEISDVCKYLKKWNIILKDINEITGQDSQDVKISFVDNGSLEFFFDNYEVTATIVITAVERLAALYKKILDIRKVRLDLQKYEFPKSEQLAIEKHEVKTIEKDIKETVEVIFSKYGKKKFESGRRNELKNALNLHLKYIAKELDKGVVVEVNPPSISEPEKQEDQSKAEFTKVLEAHEKKKTSIELIKSKLSAIEEFTDITKEAFKYLKGPEEDEEKKGK